MEICMCVRVSMHAFMFSLHGSNGKCMQPVIGVDNRMRSSNNIRLYEVDLDGVRVHQSQHYAISSQMSIKMDRDCYVNRKTHTISSRDMLTEVNL